MIPQGNSAASRIPVSIGAVTDFAHAPALTRLTGAETRLTAGLARPRRVAIACIVALTALGWIALALMAGPQGFEALCRPALTGGWSDFAVALPMWAAMALAMMLPTAGPMILTYSEIADTALAKGEAVASPLVLAAGYLAVWLGFAVAASGLQIALARAGWLGTGQMALAVSGTLFAVAGLYQFSTLKHACLTQCQRPFPFFFANWTDEARGVFRLGLRQGLYCLGCCWATMLLMLATGAMNAVWMAALGVIMTVEKLTVTPRFARVMGGVFLAVGAGFLVAAFWQG